MKSDLDLLRDYEQTSSEDSFSALVHRHLNLVYSAALRQVRSPHLAEEVAQSVFTDLARQAHRLGPGTILTAWLYQVTRRAAIDVVRRETRRQSREQVAYELTAMNANDADWAHIEPLLDETMHALDDTDRTAVLLRYFENKTLREVGQTLGTTEDAAQKRVSRAVERLREFFGRRGVSVGAGGLVAVLSSNAIQAAPVGLSAAIATTSIALVGTAVATNAAITPVTQVIAMTTLQKALIATALVAAVGTGIYEARQASTLRAQVQTLQQQKGTPAGGFEQLTRERDSATRKLAGLQAENDRLNRNTAELLRLRAEVTRLKSAAQGKAEDAVTDAAAGSWISRVKSLKQRVTEHPEVGIPEFQFLTEQDWLNATKGPLETEQDYRRALSALRSAAENVFVKKLQPALVKYMKANEGKFPTESSQLQPFFESPMDEALFPRYEILPAKQLSTLGMGGDWIITQKAVDKEYDQRWGIGPYGFGTTGFGNYQTTQGPLETLAPALKSFFAANQGQELTDPSQLQSFVTTDEQRATLGRAIQSFKTMSPEEKAELQKQVETFKTRGALGGN